jgi:hypothetical protein
VARRRLPRWLTSATFQGSVRLTITAKPDPSVAPQFIYVMKGLRKVIPPSRIILEDIWLSFYR